VNESGDPLSQSGWQTVWRRFTQLAIKEGVISKNENFGLHDMKRRGVTDTTGTKADKLDATGLGNFSILKVYDKSIV
jgi:hypothetical protein